MRKGIRRKMLAIGTLLMLVLGFATVAQAQEVYITAEIFQSNGDAVDSGHDGTAATVTVINKNTGSEKDYPAVLDDGWVVVAVAEDSINPGDRVRIKVDGSGWNDADYYVHVMGDESTIDFVYNGPPGVPIQAQSYKYAPMNLKPVIALIFIILILLFGFLFLGMMNRQKVNVVVTGKERDKVQTKQGLVEKTKYTCSYGDEDDLKEIGSFHDGNDYAEASLLKISVRKVMKKPDGSYEWYDPRPMDMSKLTKEQMPTEPDTEEMVDKKWFQGGSLSPRKGQTMKSASQRYTHRLFTAFVYPFLVLELIFGVGSFWYEPFQFPPSVAILIINILILIIAMIFMIVWFSKSTKEEKPKEKPGAPEAAAAPARFEEMRPVKAEEPKEVVAEEIGEEPKVEEEAPAAVAEEAPAAAVTPTPVSEEKKIPCPNCGQELGADFVVCPFCGESIK